ncbi:hypothetical protein [Vibrio rhodolitus]|uniref:hypothetical protein n=1 Tax=Vibrio rhodolitus TaxID=2231649 RepID=UPI001FC8EBDD|nr:hypothetical protein [Vibrio rhodolitus]
MKEKLFAIDDIDHCPLCNCDEFLISESGSFLCAQCGSFFENVNHIVSHQAFTPTSSLPIISTHSMLAH